MEANPYYEIFDYSHFIDVRNKYWYDRVVLSSYTFKVQFDSRKTIGDDWKFSGINNQITITFPKNDFDKNLFTLELLHACFYVNKFHSWKRPEILKCCSDSFQTTFKQVQEGLLNSMQHLKMFPLFCAARFDPLKFRTDYERDDNIGQRLEQLESNDRDIFFKNYIELFSIAIDSTKINQALVNEKCLVKLKTVSPDLYQILEKATRAWITHYGYFFDDIYAELVEALDRAYKI